MAAILLPISGSYAPYALTLPMVLLARGVVLFRFGFLTWVVMLAVSGLVGYLPVTNDPSDWYFASTVLAVILITGLGAFGMRTALAGNAVFKDELLSSPQ